MHYYIHKGRSVEVGEGRREAKRMQGAKEGKKERTEGRERGEGWREEEGKGEGGKGRAGGRKGRWEEGHIKFFCNRHCP